MFQTDNEEILKVVKTIGCNRMSIREIMDAIGLKGRDNFLTLYLNPAIAQGFVSMRYPDKPRHPRQSYLLTDKGTMLWKILRKEDAKE